MRMRQRRMSKGNLFLISGPSGCGKDTLLAEVFKRCPDIKFSISSITRPMRQGEVEGEKYHFISREEFEDMIKQDALLEYNCFVGNYYGTPRKPVEECLENGNDMFIEIDVNGAEQIRKKMPQAISIFIMPPSMEILKQRLVDRGSDSPESIAKRLECAVSEVKRANEYDYTVVNDDLFEAVEKIVEIIANNRLK